MRLLGAEKTFTERYKSSRLTGFLANLGIQGNLGNEPFLGQVGEDLIYIRGFSYYLSRSGKNQAKKFVSPHSIFILAMNPDLS